MCVCEFGTVGTDGVGSCAQCYIHHTSMLIQKNAIIIHYVLVDHHIIHITSSTHTDQKIVGEGVICGGGVCGRFFWAG